MLFLLIFAVITGVIASMIGSGRGGNAFGWFCAGFFLSVLGIALAFTAGKPCPHCRSKIHPSATRCPKCGGEIVGTVPLVHQHNTKEFTQQQARNRLILTVGGLLLVVVLSVLFGK